METITDTHKLSHHHTSHIIHLHTKKCHRTITSLQNSDHISSNNNAINDKICDMWWFIPAILVLEGRQEKGMESHTKLPGEIQSQNRENQSQKQTSLWFS